MNILKEEIKDAICNNDIEFLTLHKYQYSINECFEDEDNDTLLLYSLSDRGSKTYLFFLENGADIYAENDKGEGALHSIVYSGDVERLKKVYSTYPDLEINKRSEDGVTPLLLSVALGKFQIFLYLLEQGADVNIPDEDGNAPIHVACSIGEKRFAKPLIESGANLQVKSGKGNYPLAIAVNGDFLDIIHMLYRRVYSS